MTLKNGQSQDEGGAIYNVGTLNVNTSAFSNNSATNRGGAISNKGTGALTIKRSAFNGNRTTGGQYGLGGAIKLWFDASASITNSTFYGNSARVGGAIHHNSTLTVTNSTFVANTASYRIGSAIRTASGSLRLRNSLLSDNIGGDACEPFYSSQVTQSVANYIDDGTCQATYSSDVGPINLGAPTGSPAYYPLLDSSIAVDTASSDFCPAIDQAGTARPIGNGCDIGAHESSALAPSPTQTPTSTPIPPTPTETQIPSATPTPTTRPTVDPLAPLTVDASCSLADAITAANSDTATGGCGAGNGADTITLTADITLGAALPYITSKITIAGVNYFISGADSYLIFRVGGAGNLTLNNLTLKNGRSQDEGGAIYNDGKLHVNSSTFSNNSATNRGGAISNKGTLRITRSTFNGNRATGGQYGIGGAISDTDTARTTINNSTFYQNRADFGGAINVYGNVTVTNSTFVANTGDFFGSAIRTYITGYLILRNSLLSDNIGSYACYTHVRELSQSNNYIDDGTCNATYSSGDGSINLGALTGSPAYYPLLDNSIAIDAANGEYCPATDQAGTARPIGNRCDIGAHESSSLAPSPTPTKTSTPTPTGTLTATATPEMSGQQIEETATPTVAVLSSRGVYGLTLVSNSAGELTASWTEPVETPDDYRISWAKADEDYADATDLDGNAYPTSPEYTISGLENGETYKDPRARALLRRIGALERRSGSPGDGPDGYSHRYSYKHADRPASAR